MVALRLDPREVAHLDDLLANKRYRTDRDGRHEVELEAARRVAARIGVERHAFVDIDLRAFGGSALTSGRPQPPQNRIPDGLSSPHCSQVGDIRMHHRGPAAARPRRRADGRDRARRARGL